MIGFSLLYGFGTVSSLFVVHFRLDGSSITNFQSCQTRNNPAFDLHPSALSHQDALSNGNARNEAIIFERNKDIPQSCLHIQAPMGHEAQKHDLVRNHFGQVCPETPQECVPKT